MAFNVSIRLEKSEENENILSSLGLLNLRWDDEDQAYQARCTSRSWTALGQQGHLIPFTLLDIPASEREEYDEQAKPVTIRKFARAAAVAAGNAYFNSMAEPANDVESAYLDMARSAIFVLEGLGVDPDAFASMYADPGGAFTRRVSYSLTRSGQAEEA